MTVFFSEDEVVVSVTKLTRSELDRFVDGGFVRPRQAFGGYLFCPVDIARLELLCDLSQDLDLDDTALAVVISLVDQLHAVRRDLAALARAMDSLPADLREQIETQMRQG